MAKGRRPEPAEMQAAKGDPGKRGRDRIVETDALEVLADQPPPQITGLAAEVWRELLPSLRQAKFVRRTDHQAFARYCNDVARYWRVTQELDEEGETYWTDTNHGKMKRINPTFIVQERLHKRIEAAEDRIGLNPAARQQMMLRQATVATPGDLFDRQSKPALEEETAGPVGILGRAPIH